MNIETIDKEKERQRLLSETLAMQSFDLFVLGGQMDEEALAGEKLLLERERIRLGITDRNQPRVGEIVIR